MTINLHKMKQQTQETILRLFVDSYSTLPKSHYTCGHVGTHARLHQ